MIRTLRARLKAKIGVLAPLAPLVAVVFFLFATNTFMDAQTLSPSQEADVELGSAAYSVTLFSVAVPAGSDLADRLVTQFDDSTLGYSVAVNAFDFPYFKDGLSGIYFSEKDWAAHPPDRQFRLTQGRWPATAGEVTLAGHDFTDARGRPHQDTSPRPGPQGGGGRRQSAGGVAPDARGTRHLGADCPGSAGT
ncbi:MAG TPA: hypothetical protein PLZ93_11510 [Nocardioides sp.]|uniref:hypothetical protein n=1 Tax=uncultured Nocardioides sp. TaxID=198441 RepID=UPI000ED350BD|nr:hypothetical protein [uncultured Nocardioides sp.]HCB07236.1 hypothetical protein [Nocardioides sp.]HRD60246.1 hypothetical protein [Nocardioides sp.]HRI96235.1 hypothetical protein [Nocardioides sp.]HRK44959.1 hypothetical protein [Nocardioides sp.]